MPRSLTAHIVASVVLAQLLLAAGLVWAGLVFTRRQLQQAFNLHLVDRTMSVDALVHDAPQAGAGSVAAGGGLVFNAAQAPPPRRLRIPDFYQVRDAAGQMVGSDVPPGVAVPAPGVPLEAAVRRQPLPGSELQYWEFTYRGQRYRGARLTGAPLYNATPELRKPAVRVTVYYMSPLLDLQHETAEAGFAIGGASLLLVLLTSWLAAWMVRRELHPLRALAQQAAAITPRHWSFEGDPRTAPAELAPLICALQCMLQSLQNSFQQQRDFMADAAHHLKTPVAVVKSTLQALLQRPRPPVEYQAGLQATLADVERLEQILQRLLRLARLEHSDQRPAGWAELSATCTAALERVQPLAEARGVELRTKGLEREHWLCADADDLELAWLNLLENAVQHSPARAPVTLACAQEGDALRVEVRDQGPGVPAAERAHIFDRFYRGADAVHAGSGLGLAISHAIIKAYGGSIAVSASAAGVGAVFTVVLPLAASE